VFSSVHQPSQLYQVNQMNLSLTELVVLAPELHGLEGLVQQQLPEQQPLQLQRVP
jgi:hypothetical protein